jgi:hypothetical protein
MAQDPVSVVASWIAPARAGGADELSTTAAPMDDPVIALIAEERRLQGLATAACTRCDEILATLPEDVQKRRAKVSFSGEISGLFRNGFSSASLKDVVRFVPELAPLAANALKAPDADDAEAESAAGPRRRRLRRARRRNVSANPTRTTL